MSVQQTYDVLVKCIVIGDSGTGKSCILHRFTENKFLEDCTHTIGVEFGAKVVDVMNKSVKLQIWDTAGQERYRGVTRSYYRGAMACLLVYDITDRESFNHVEKWLSDARLLAGPDIAVMLVGNKSDLAYSQRQVTQAEASQLAAQNGMLLFETSARTGEHIDEAFLKIAKTVLMRQSDLDAPQEEHDTVDLVAGTASDKKKKSCPC